VPTATATHATADELAFRAAWDEFFAAVRRARGRAARDRKPGSLTLAQFQLLAAFEDARELSVGELALAGGVAPPTATRMLSALERDGLVERRESEADRRSVLVSPTSKGRRLLREKRKLIAAKQQAIFDSLTAREREQAEAILQRLAVAMEEL
jgi:DNA-binding MarR family transcriptional regulator